MMKIEGVKYSLGNDLFIKNIFNGQYTGGEYNLIIIVS